MNFPMPNPPATTDSRPIISTYSILLLSGMLFGICASGSMAQDIKSWVTLSGTLGLVAYLVVSLNSHAQKQSNQRLAAIQVEERLDRHSHFDLRAEDLGLNPPNSATKPA